MARKYQGGTLPRALREQQFEKRRASVGVERGGGLVSNYELGRTDQRACGSHALLLAYAELAHRATQQRRIADVELSKQPYCLESRCRIATGRAATSQLGETARQQYVLDDRQIRDQIEHLKDVTDVIGTEPITRRAGLRSEIASENAHRTFLRRYDASQEV